MRFKNSRLLNFACVSFFVLMLGLPQVALPVKKSLKVPQIYQEQDNWCWAGTSSAVLSYFGKSISQCYIADFSWSRTDCCLTPANCDYAQDMYGSGGAIDGILAHWCVKSTGQANVLSFNACKAEINGKRPFFIRYGWTDGGGHFIVVKGYSVKANGTSPTLELMDPYYGPEVFPYSYVVSAADHTWTHTLNNIKMTKAAADWMLSNSTPTSYYYTGYWSFEIDITEFLGGCGKVNKFSWDFYSASKKHIGHQNNTAADFAAWFNDCNDGDIQFPNETKFCGSLWATLGGLTSGYVKLTFQIKPDKGGMKTKSILIYLPNLWGSSSLKVTDLKTPSVGKVR